MQDNIQTDIETKDLNKTKTDRDLSQESSSDSKYSEGQVLKFIRVRFPGHAKSYPFLIGKRKLAYGQKVVAMSDRGMAVGYINSFPYDIPFKKDMLPLKTISKIASIEDINNEKDNYKKQKETETLCQKLIEKHKLQMTLTNVEFTSYGKKVVFYFIAPARVDFRNLVRDLVNELKLRIELRQISVRDRSAAMGALGPCGRELCCSSFLTKYGNVSVKMAKNQSLTLNYSKLNGVCGQLKCCLQYEDEVYSAKRKKMPDEGSYILTTDGTRGKVTRIHILSEQFDVLTNKGHIRRYVSSMFDKKTSMEDAQMPKRFDHISDETSTIVGLTDKEAKDSKNFQRDLDKLTGKAHKFAFDNYYDLTELDRPEYIAKEMPKTPTDADFLMPVMKKGSKSNSDAIIEFKADIEEKSQIDNKSEVKTQSKTAEISSQDSKEKKPNRNNNRNRNRNRNRNKSGKKPEATKK
jgi:cell fate regulator YaaT (PSP1 superfamily)